MIYLPSCLSRVKLRPCYAPRDDSELTRKQTRASTLNKVMTK